MSGLLARSVLSPVPGTLVCGLAFTLLLLGCGGSLYVLLGGTDGALAQALAYSDVLFAGAVLVWLANTFASALRGSGNTAIPAIALITAALVQIPLSGALTLGWWPFPALGIRGTALSYALGLHTFFNHPIAVAGPSASGDLSMNEALMRRAFGLIAGPISNGIAAFLGWLMGGVLPERTM